MEWGRSHTEAALSDASTWSLRSPNVSSILAMSFASTTGG